MNPVGCRQEREPFLCHATLYSFDGDGVGKEKSKRESLKYDLWLRKHESLQGKVFRSEIDKSFYIAGRWTCRRQVGEDEIHQ